MKSYIEKLAETKVTAFQSGQIFESKDFDNFEQCYHLPNREPTQNLIAKAGPLVRFPGLWDPATLKGGPKKVRMFSEFEIKTLFYKNSENWKSGILKRGT